jgi:hypothetical protein
MLPFEREAILTCSGQYGPQDRNHWVIYIGGSNNFFEYKTTLDMLLETPFNAIYSPQVRNDPILFVVQICTAKASYNTLCVYIVIHQDNWGGDSSVPNWAELGTFDMIWDANHNIVHKSVYGMGCNGDYYSTPCNVHDIFFDAPVVPLGGFRFSYINFHVAIDFQRHFDYVLSASTPWIATNPAIDVRMEWTGMWEGYAPPGVSVHVDNINYLESRHSSEGLDIRSFVINDSASDCGDPFTFISDQIIDAIAQTAGSTSFTTRYFSKRSMMKAQNSLTGNCMTNGHSFQPINHVFASRYFNMICHPPEQRKSAEFPRYCLDLQGYESQCFNLNLGIYGVPNDGTGWMVNLYSVCPVQFTGYTEISGEGYCQNNVPPESLLKLPTCPKTEFSSLGIIYPFSTPETSISCKQRSKLYHYYAYVLLSYFCV